MLRRYIDVTVGLVDDAIGTVMGIYATRISIKKQFPLILSYAITIHKCQVLSLDTAIMDLSTDVLGDGMAYVALSRVRTINGLHLLSLDALSVKSKKDDVIFTYEEPSNPDIVRRKQWDYVYHTGNEEFQRCCESKAATPGSSKATTPGLSKVTTHVGTKSLSSDLTFFFKTARFLAIFLHIWHKNLWNMINMMEFLLLHHQKLEMRASTTTFSRPASTTSTTSSWRPATSTTNGCWRPATSPPPPSLPPVAGGPPPIPPAAGGPATSTTSSTTSSWRPATSCTPSSSSCSSWRPWNGSSAMAEAKHYLAIVQSKSSNYYDNMEPVQLETGASSSVKAPLIKELQ
uniref:ATP-dependent DNA helicase n=1 Tax=Amphimedon queenslandica TaxID=400682 RepID=A0A1X7TZZ2_AMPQE